MKWTRILTNFDNDSNMNTPHHGSTPPLLHHTFVVMFSFVTVIYFDTSKSFVRYWLKYLPKALQSVCFFHYLDYILINKQFQNYMCGKKKKLSNCFRKKAIDKNLVG